MDFRLVFALVLAIVPFNSASTSPQASACGPAPPNNKPVVNADQTVIMIWDPESKTQHFIRQASFKSAADDFGFIIPSPAQPELGEASTDAFSQLAKMTEPETITKKRPAQGVNCACGGAEYPCAAGKAESVRILDAKDVAGYRATVLEASTANALVDWLKENGYLSRRRSKPGLSHM
jgi:hypothetical protein